MNQLINIKGSIDMADGKKTKLSALEFAQQKWDSESERVRLDNPGIIIEKVIGFRPTAARVAERTLTCGTVLKDRV